MPPCRVFHPCGGHGLPCTASHGMAGASTPPHAACSHPSSCWPSFEGVTRGDGRGSSTSWVVPPGTTLRKGVSWDCRSTRVSRVHRARTPPTKVAASSAARSFSSSDSHSGQSEFARSRGQQAQQSRAKASGCCCVSNAKRDCSRHGAPPVSRSRSRTWLGVQHQGVGLVTAGRGSNTPRPAKSGPLRPRPSRHTSRTRCACAFEMWCRL